MTATNHTENYNLSQFVGTDRPTWLGDYNGDMTKIDAAIHAAAQSGGLTAVAHTDDLTGDGSTGNPLGVADTIARSEDIPSLDGYATTESVTQAIAAAIADRLTAGDIKPGNGINIETSGNQVTVSYVGDGSAGGLSAVAHDATLTGDGTGTSPLGITSGTAINEKILTKVTVDFNDYTEPGFYGCNDVSVEHAPHLDSPTRFSFLVLNCGYVGSSRKTCCIQVLFNRGLDKAEIYMRTAQYGGNWGDWVKFVTNSEYNNLASRVTALERALSPSAPQTTGLTAKELDTQYPDSYNIVRVGAPTRNNESEEPRHE